MFVVCGVERKNRIIYMVLSVGLDLRIGKFEPWLDQKGVNVQSFYK